MFCWAGGTGKLSRMLCVTDLKRDLEAVNFQKGVFFMGKKVTLKVVLYISWNITWNIFFNIFFVVYWPLWARVG